MPSIGETFVDVHANTDPFARELDRDLERAAKDAESGLERTGTDFGDKIADSTSKSLGRRGKDYARAIENATRNTLVRVRSTFSFSRIRDAIRRTFRRDVGDTIDTEISRAFDRAGRPGGPISKLGEAFSDAIGAGFNISGRSPLIALLLPALAALLGLILGLVQAVNALVAVLLIVPGLLASIGLQVGVIAIAFQGMGEAIQGAFAAKNAKELREALKGLTPSARNFVRELLPLRDLFKEIGRTVQENFFAKLTGVITAIRRSLGPSLVTGFGALASAMGQFVEDFGLLLASPAFKNFFNKLIPATGRWLDKFGMSLFGRRGFVTALIDMATELMPFMERFGDVVLRNLDTLAALMFRIGTDPRTTKWLDSMAATLQLVFDLLFKLGEFLFVFMAQLDAQGGKQIFTELIRAIELINFFLASPAGAKAMEGLINLGIIGIKTTTGLIIAILAVIAAGQKLAEWFTDFFIPATENSIRGVIGDIIGFVTFLGVWIERIVNAVRGFFLRADRLGTQWRNNFIGFVRSVIAWIVRFLQEIGRVPGAIIARIGSLGGLLVNAGRNLIQGLINGVKQKAQELYNLIGSVVNRIAGFFGASPAKEGALSGRGWTLYRGQNIMKDLIKGIEMEVPDLRRTTLNATSNIVFGRDAVQVNFQGTPPTETQARSVGSAVGNAAANYIATRNARLAVRTL